MTPAAAYRDLIAAIVRDPARVARLDAIYGCGGVPVADLPDAKGPKDGATAPEGHLRRRTT